MSVRQQGAVPTASPIGVDRLTAVLEAGERHARSKQLGKATEEFGVDIVSDPTDAKSRVGIPKSVKDRMNKNKYERDFERERTKNAKAKKNSDIGYRNSKLIIQTLELKVKTNEEKLKQLQSKTHKKTYLKELKKLQDEIITWKQEIEAEKVSADRLKPA
jgi:hypothetical protein